jgi:hypothetical protein
MEEKGVFGGLEHVVAPEEFLKFMRFSFDVAFDNMVKVQDFNVKAIRDMLEKSKDIHSDTVRVVSEFIESAKKGRDEYKKMMTDGLDKVGELLAKKK